MKIKLNKKYKITLIVISIALLLCVTIGISYAYWQITKKQTNANVLSTGCFEIAFEETGSDISLNNALPISDQKGLSKTPYKFKLKNICTYDSEYYVTLNSFGTTDKLLNENAIKYAFDVSTKTNPTPKILGAASENTETGSIDLTNLIKSYYLKAGYLRAGEEKEFSLHLWMDQDAPMSEMNKTFSSKICVTSIATTEAPLIANLKVATDGDATTNYLDGPLVKNTIEKIEFVETNKVPSDVIGSWDVSEQQNGAITAWYYDSDKNGKYEVYIGQEEGVIANPNSIYLFRYLENLNELNLERLIVSDVTNMERMFQGTGYNSTVFMLDLGNQFNTSKVTSMNNMFHNTGYSSPVFTLDLGNEFNTSKVTTMQSMFHNTGYSSTVFTLNLGNQFNTSNVTTMQSIFAYTGYSSTVFTLNLGNNFDTSNVRNMANMFDTTGRNSLDFTLDLGDKFNTSKVTNMISMFNTTGRNSKVFTLDLGDNFDTSNVITMNSMFLNMGYSSPVFTLNLGEKFDTSKVTNMSYMFSGTGYSSTIFTINLGNKFNTSKVTDMNAMFNTIGYNSTKFTLDVSNFNTSNVTNMSYMFSGTGYNSTTFTLDVSNFDTSKVTSMSYMFCNIGRNNTNFVLNLGENFNTSNVTAMERMFQYVGDGNSLFTLNLRTFNFDKVTSYNNIFYGSKATHTIYVKNASDKTWVSEKGFAGSIVDCSSNTCP